jgi:hypothetical protein
MASVNRRPIIVLVAPPLDFGGTPSMCVVVSIGETDGHHFKPRAVSAPPPVIDLMAALKRSLARERPTEEPSAQTAQKRKGSAADRRQAALLLPLSGGRKRDEKPATKPATVAPKQRDALFVAL